MKILDNLLSSLNSEVSVKDIRHGLFQWSLRPKQSHLKREFVRQVVLPEIV